MTAPSAESGRTAAEPSGLLGHARIAFVTFTDNEHEAGRVIFGSDVQIPNTSCWTSGGIDHGPLDLDTVHVRAERSNLPAMQRLEDAIASFRPCFILTCGTAGGVNGRDGLRLGDLVVGDFVEYYEFAKVSSVPAKRRGRNRQRRPDNEPLVRPRHIAFDHPAALLWQTLTQYVREAGTWKQRVQARPPRRRATKVLSGMILAGEKILQAEETQYQRALLERYDKALAIETESYGIASAVYRARSDKRAAFRYHYNPLFLPIRGISDLVDATDAQENREKWSPFAAQAACAFALAVAERLLATLTR